jgi:hypothetical protein
MTRVLAGLLLVVASLACIDFKGPSFNVCGGDPDPCAASPPPCDSREISSLLFFSWTIDGFTREQLVDPNARTDLVVQLRVGQAQSLTIAGTNAWRVDCTGEIAAVRWGLGTPGVVGLRPHDALMTTLSAIAPGDTTIFADLDFKNGQHVHARPFLFTNTSSGTPTIRVVP